MIILGSLLLDHLYTAFGRVIDELLGTTVPSSNLMALITGSLWEDSNA